MQIFRFSEVGSTNDVALEKLFAGERPMFGVSAETQTKGRGCRGHSWVSEKGNLFISFALNISDIQAEDLQIFPQCVSLSFAKKLSIMPKICLKWPNDIFLDQKKVGGVLLETKFEKMSLRYAVLGIGVNISVSPNIGDSNKLGYSTGKLSTDGKQYNKNEIERIAVSALKDTVSLAQKGKLGEFLQKNWQFFDIFFGRKITVMKGKARFYGDNMGVDVDGALILREKSGNLRRFNSAEAEIIIDC